MRLQGLVHCPIPRAAHGEWFQYTNPWDWGYPQSGGPQILDPLIWGTPKIGGPKPHSYIGLPDGRQCDLAPLAPPKGGPK